jgi:hypothetical protein
LRPTKVRYRRISQTVWIGPKTGSPGRMTSLTIRLAITVSKFTRRLFLFASPRTTVQGYKHTSVQGHVHLFGLCACGHGTHAYGPTCSLSISPSVDLLCMLFLFIVYIQIHTHLKWGGYEWKIIIH